jgi:Sugar-transfer associated ATP-grasp
MATAVEVIQHVKRDAEFNLPRSLQLAASAHGKSPGAQVMDIWRLRFGPGKLRPDEYYAYGLYDDRRFGLADKLRFLGRAIQDRIIRRCNAPEWWLLAHDKLVFYALLAGLGLPVPATRAVYHASRRLGAAVALAQPAALAAHLRLGMTYPCFAKPVTGIRSLGVAALEAYDAAADRIVLKGGQALEVEAFVGQLERYRAGGYLFQELLRSHPELEAALGPRLATVRLIVLLEDNGPAVLHALCKIPVGDNPADNFWRPGNLLAALDAGGRVTRVVQGTGPEQREPESHPDTGGCLKALTIPDWPALTALGLQAATAFPGLRMQAWDIAPTDHGPVLVEVNIGGDFNLPQLAHQTGLMDDRFRGFLAACAATST